VSLPSRTIRPRAIALMVLGSLILASLLLLHHRGVVRLTRNSR